MAGAINNGTSILSESEQALEDICIANGLNSSELKAPGYKAVDINYLEMFFIGFSNSIIHMDKFPNLTTLKIIAQDLTLINGLDSCFNLNELWIAECKIAKINGLKNCTNLKKLYLYSNKISKIENLAHVNLEKLWLNDNKIAKIEGISHMTNLVDLNLARNCILSIGDSLKTFQNLEILNLASNQIDKLHEISNLQSLSNLKHFCLKDPQYGYNPITINCNYSLYVIYHLPGLITLDTLQISQKVFKELADSTINKKKLWYFMKFNSLNRQFNELVERLDNYKMRHNQPIIDQINKYSCKVRDIRKLMNITRDKDNESKQKEDLIKYLEEKINDNKTKLKLIENQYQTTIVSISSNIDKLKLYNLIELENCGNIRFEYGNELDIWYKSCFDLVMSRFCENDYTEYGICGIKIKNIIRITNRYLLSKFEENLLAEVDELDYINNKPSLKKKLEYLMYSWRPKLGDQIQELVSIIKYGFRFTSDYREAGYDEAIPFTNNLNISDSKRLELLFDKAKSTIKSKNGNILLCKVFTSKFCPYNKGEIMQKNYLECLGMKQQPKTNQLTKDSTETSTSTECDCKSKQYEWFLFNRYLAVPEYIIEFEYLTKNIIDNIFDKEFLTNIDQKPLDSTKTASEDYNNNIKSKETIISSQYSSVSSDLNSFNSNTETILKKEIESLVQSDDLLNLENLVDLNLHNCHIFTLNTNTDIINFNNLKKLIFSFNKLKSIDELSLLPNLEYLDVSYNQIASISSFKAINKISHFDISNNNLDDLVSLLNTLNRYFLILNYLDITNNSIKRVNKLNSALLFYLKSLNFFNGEKIKPEDRNLDSFKIETTIDLIKENSWTIQNRPRNLSYLFVTELVNNKNVEFAEHKFDLEKAQDNQKKLQNKEEELSLEDINNNSILNNTNNFYLAITTLNLDNQNLLRMCNMESLENLKYASFKNNFIVNIEGLDKCLKLEELSLQNNLIQSLNGLEALENLRKLDLSQNEIVYIDENHKSLNSNETKNWDIELPRLTNLSISNNRISSIRFVKKMPALIEFYASFNNIKLLRDIFNLKQLTSLAILDLCCNPMSKESNKYRLFLIYHLRNLKSLDGTSIEPNEITESRDLFGGKLTCDFIAEKCNHNKLNEIKVLEFVQCNIRHVDLGATMNLVNEQFESLRSLNLENNFLTSFSGLIYLKNLKILCLNNNKIESIFPKSKLSNGSGGASIPNSTSQVQVQVQIIDKILPNLEVLHLAYNGITDLVNLQIGLLSTLKVLFLQGNEITKIDGLETLRDLRELVLDKNKIKFINEKSFLGQTQRLHELHLEENRLRDLSNIEQLKNLQKLFVANNRISEISDIDRLLELNHLIEISLINNPISRRPHYRIHLVFRLKKMRVLDMSEVTDEDRLKAEIYFNEQLQLQQQNQPLYAPMFYTGMAQVQQQLNGMMQSSQQQQQSQHLQQQPQQPSVNQIEHQLLVLSQSPRLKPIPIIDKPIINNSSQPINIISSNMNSNKKLRNPLEKLNKDLTRFRNQYN